MNRLLVPTSLFVLLASILAPTAATAQPRFVEVSEAWNVDFRHNHGGTGKKYMPETMVGGVVMFDYDDDGDEDLFYVNGGPTPGYEGERPRSRLYRNDGGRFVDVTDMSGIVVTGYGSGGAAADTDNDGDLDLYVTAYGANQLFANNGDGTFTDVSKASGVDDTLWGAAAAFGDIDHDGDLDLFVSNYVDFDFETETFDGNRELDARAYYHPGHYNALPNRLYRNRGDGTFEDVTASSGLGKTPYAGLGALFGDLDNDGDLDLYVANDTHPNNLFLNQGDGTFEDVSLLSGTSHSDRGRPEAGMGVDFGDIDGDGQLDILVTNFELETNALYKNNGFGLFTDVRFTSNLAEKSLTKLAFGTCFSDFDNDGDLDVAIANGHILDNAEQIDPKSTYKQQNQVFENLGKGKFREVETAGLDVVRASRGLACGDLDGDGDVDLAFSNSNDEAEVYDNRTPSAGRAIWVRLDGTTNRFGVGGWIEATREGSKDTQVREVRSGASYLSQHPMSQHFGLGDAKSASVSIRWPEGRRQRWDALASDLRYRLYEPAPVTTEESSD